MNSIGYDRGLINSTLMMIRSKMLKEVREGPIIIGKLYGHKQEKGSLLIS